MKTTKLNTLKLWAISALGIAAVAFSAHSTAQAQVSTGGLQNPPYPTKDFGRTVSVSHRTTATAEDRSAPEQAPTVQTAETPSSSSSARASYSNDLFRVTKEQVSGSRVGGEFAYRINVEALRDIANLRVDETLADSVSLVSTTPEASVDGSTLSWSVPSLNRGETRSFDVVVIPSQDGEFSVCSVVTADPRLCITMIAGSPQLTIEKTGPAASELNESVNWVITVTNTGTATAQNVVVNDTLPNGFNANGPVSHEVGSLRPGESRQIQVAAVGTQTGDFVNTASANFEGGEPVQASAPIAIVESRVAINKEGPAEEFIYKPVPYTITVTNEGTTTLRNLVVQDVMPAETQLIESGNGAVQGNTITWTIPSLASGESVSYNVRLTSSQPQTTVNRATVQTESGLRADSEVTTIWHGVPGVHLEVSDSRDPITVGSRTVYTLTVKNQGQFRPVDSLLRFTLTDNIRPISTSGNVPGLIEGQVVTFPSATLQPGQDLVLRVTAEAVAPGIGVGTLELEAEFLGRTIRSEEPTNVY